MQRVERKRERDGERTKEMLEGVEGQGETAMVVDGFGGGDAEEEGSLADRHGRGPVSDDGTQGV
jgi:hypothetical protein